MADEIKKVIKIESDSSQAQADLEKVQGKFASVFKNLQTQASAFGPALGVGLGVGAIVGFGKNLVDLGDKLGDLSDQTGLSIAVLGGFRQAAVQNGASVDDLARAVLTAQRNLGKMDEDGQDAAQALKRLGLNIREMQNASPDEFLEKFGQKLATIENRNDRAAIAALLFKKAGDQVNTSIIQWVNEGMTRLDESTAQAYKRLGDLKDQLAKLTAASYDFAAKGIGNILKGVGAIPASVKELEAQLEHLKKFAPGDIGAQMATQKQLDVARAVEAQPNAKPADFRGLAVTKSSAAATKDTGVQDFFGNLQKQVEGIDLEFTKLKDGDRLAKEVALDLQFADFNMRRLAEGKPLASLEQFKGFKEVILSAGDALEKTKHDLDAIAAVGKAMSQDSAEWLNVGEDLEKIRKEREPLIRQFQDLRDQLKIDLLPEGSDEKRVAQIVADYQRTSERIQELARAAGISNEESAQLAADAWQKAASQIDDVTNKSKQQFQEIFEGVGQAFGDAFTQLGQGGKFKDVFKNMVGQIQRVVTDSLVTKPLQEMLKKAAKDISEDIFGTGKTGGTEGGVLGGIFGLGKPKGDGGYYAGNDPGTPAIPTPFGPIMLPDGGGSGTPAFSLAVNQFAAAVQQFIGSTGIGSPLDENNLPPDVEKMPDGSLYYHGNDPGIPATETPFGPIFGNGDGAGAAGDQAGVQAQMAAAQASLEALSTEASATIQALSAESTTAIEAASTAGTTAIETAGSTAEAAITAIQAEAIAAIQAAATAAQSSSSGGSSMGGGIPFLSMFSSSGPTDAGAASEGGGLTTSMGYHQGGLVGRLHAGGRPMTGAVDMGAMHSDAAQKIMKQFASVKPNERLAILEDGEFVLRKEAVRDIGLGPLRYANEKFELPRFHEGGPSSPEMLRATPMTMPERAREKNEGWSGPTKVEFHVHGVTDADSFKRNMPTIGAGVRRMIDKSSKF